MVFSVDSDQNKILATIQNGNWKEKYECIITACENPVCTCGNVYFDLIPVKLDDDDDNKKHVHHRKVEIDIYEKALGYKNKKRSQKRIWHFQNYFLEH